LLAQLGVLDFAGGIVVHTIAGFAALASVFFVGPRVIKDRGPHSIPLVALGTGLLWFGWYGFNAGSELAVDSVTALAFVNTDIAASVAGATWLAVAWILEKKPKFVGFLTGAVAGLATITPAAGFVTPGASFVIGLLAGFVCYGAISIKNKRQWDDALDVWGVHGIGGAIGVILLGVFATTAVNANGVNGLLAGGVVFFGMQVGAVALAMVWAFVFTYVMLFVINKITPVRVTDVEESSLDEGQLGEEAYIEEEGEL
jgi:Amt family ammonium transporter